MTIISQSSMRAVSQIRLPGGHAPVLPVANKAYSSGLVTSPRGAPVFISRGIGWAIYPVYRARVKPALWLEAPGAVLRFETKEHLAAMAVALASMTAKLVRELAMHRFNRHWCGRVPELKPTAGYRQDASRWASSRSSRR